MNTTVERLEPSKIRLTVTVTAPEVDEAIEQAYKRMAGKIRIPGFRAGKAPKAMIDTHVGREAVLADAQDEILNETYSEALAAEMIRPIAQPEIGEIDMIEPGTDFEYAAEIEVRPELTLASTEGLTIEVPPASASDAEVDAQIEHTRDHFATLEPVEDRGAQRDDFVLLSFTGLIEGEAYDGNTVDRYLYEMGRDLMPPEFDEAIVGAKAGDEVVARFVIPETSSNTEYVGKNAEFSITIHEVKAKVLPELDDEFASTAGGFDTFAAMRDSVREQLDHAKSVGRDRQVERAARSALAERLVGDVPEALVMSMQGDMTRDFMGGLESRGINIVEYFQATGASMEALEATMKEQALQGAREELALEALFRAQGWEITDADIDAEIALLAGEVDADPAELRRKWKVSGIIELLRAQVMHRRAVEWLTDPAHVTIVEVDSAPDELATDAPSGVGAEPATDSDSGE